MEFMGNHAKRTSGPATSRFPRIGRLVVAAALPAFSAVFAANLIALQTAAPPAVETQQGNGQPEGEQPAPAPDEAAASGNASPQPADEILQIENRLRREVLDDRARMLDWWLMATAVFLTLFGIVIAIGGALGEFFAYRRFRDLEAEARKSEAEARKSEAEARKSMESSREHAEEARKLVEETRKSRDTAESHVRKMTAESVKDNPDEAKTAAEKVQGDPAASPIGRAIAAAISLQGQGRTEDAIRKWRSIADVVAGTDDDIEARAWFSIGYLCQEKSEKPDLEEVVRAYDKALRLNPNFVSAYNNRGVAKNDLGRREEAIADYDKALRLKPDHANAYNNRGIAKKALGRHEEAIADYDKALRLNPDDAEAYSNRGVAKSELGLHGEAITDYGEAIRLKPGNAEAYYNRGIANVQSGNLSEARKDCQKALDLARRQGKGEVASNAESVLEKLGRESNS